jgi:hypothetical protein
MLAGGMVIAAPGMVPAATAQSNVLYVSAENPQFDNLFGGTQVVEIIVRDPLRDQTDEDQGEPVVKLNEIQVRMVQGDDGYWYAYIGDDTAITAFFTNNLAANNVNDNLDYGADDALIGTPGVVGYQTQFTMYSTSNFTAVGAGVIANPPTLSAYNGTISRGAGTGIGYHTQADGSSTEGQIGMPSALWPMIQTFDLTIGTFDIVLEQAGANEVVSLDYNSGDLDDYSSITLDRTAAPQGSEVHLTITDNQLNIDPTSKDIVQFNVTTGSEKVSWTNGTVSTAVTTNWTQLAGDFHAYDNSFDGNGVLVIKYDNNAVGVDVIANDATLDDTISNKIITFFETANNSGVFVNTDDADDANLIINTAAKRGTTATFSYNGDAQTLLVANSFATLDMDETSVGDEWNSGEELAVILIDGDMNLNTASNEDLLINNSTHRNPVIPSLKIGSPLMADGAHAENTLQAFSNVVYYTNSTATVGFSDNNYTISLGYTGEQLDAMDTSFTFWNYDFTSFGTVLGATLNDGEHDIAASDQPDNLGTAGKGLVQIRNPTSHTSELTVQLAISADAAQTASGFVSDIFSFGERTNNAIYRLQLEESGDNTAEFVGGVEYVMLNQLNHDDVNTYLGLDTISDVVTIIVHEDLTDEDSPRINYNDLGADGVVTQIADQQPAPSHSGVVTLDSDNYKKADTVVVTLDDQDMNTDSELIDVYVTAAGNDMVGDGSGTQVLDITFNDTTWTGLYETGFTLVETGIDSGIFVGSFQVPEFSTGTTTTTGTDIEVNYQDYRDASGEEIEVGDGASVDANTGSVSFDRTVYPVPWGTNSTASNFAEHSTAGSRTLSDGNVTVHVTVTDADYDVSASGEDVIKDTTVKIAIQRGSASTTVGTYGHSVTNQIVETAPSSGQFEIDHLINATSGPLTNCPAVFAHATDGCVLQGDIVTATYTDNTDASGKTQTVTDSATFDLRNGVLQSDKSVYLIGSDMILTLIEPDFDRDNDTAESYTLDLVEWDSDASTTTLGPNDGNNASFDPEPSKFRETGDSTGIFQVVIEVPESLDTEGLDRGEAIDLEYTDWGPAGADYVGQEDEDIGITVYTSNFGATIELDQKVYTWTDKVYITIVGNLCLRV